MNRATARAALEAIVTSITGITAGSLFWRDRPRGWTDATYAVMTLGPVTRLGRDAVRMEYDAARDHGTPSAFDELEPHQTGHRILTWGVQIWSHAATDTEDAISIAESIDDSMSLPEITAALKAADLAYGETLLLQHFDATQDDREMSVAQLDIRINATADKAGTRLGYAETWGLEGELDLPDGTTAEIVDGDYP